MQKRWEDCLLLTLTTLVTLASAASNAATPSVAGLLAAEVTSGERRRRFQDVFKAKLEISLCVRFNRIWLQCVQEPPRLIDRHFLTRLKKCCRAPFIVNSHSYLQGALGHCKCAYRQRAPVRCSVCPRVPLGYNFFNMCFSEYGGHSSTDSQVSVNSKKSKLSAGEPKLSTIWAPCCECSVCSYKNPV